MIPLMKSAFLNGRETRQALADFILSTDRLSMGEQCAAFEKAFAKKEGTADAVLFNSGGSANLALLQALKNLGRLKDGDPVGFSAITWATNVMPIIQLGMQPVPVDVEPSTINSMSSNLLERLKTNDLKAFFITNALGFIGDLDAIKKICDEREIILLEDNCEALGTESPAGKAGTFGVGATFSFFVAHHMSTIEGGMVITNDEELAEMLRIVRANGWDRNLLSHQQEKWRKLHSVASEFHSKYTFYDLAFNMRPTEITGFLGLHQLQFLDENVDIREKNHLRFEQVIKENPDLITLDHSHISKLSAFALPVVCKTPELRERYFKKFSDADVEVRPMIAGNMHRQPFYKKYVAAVHDLLGTEFIHHNSFYCGNYPELSTEDIGTIVECLRKE